MRVFCFLVLLPLVTPDNGVYVRSKFANTLVTSSTLRWVPATNGEHPVYAVVGALEIVPDESVVSNPVDLADEDQVSAVIDRKVYICRAWHNGVRVPGQLRFGRRACQVSMHGKVYSYPKYEVLGNIEDGGRLSWVRWDKFVGLPIGSVAGDQGTYVARRRNKQDSAEESERPLGLKHLMGKLELDDFNFGQLHVITPDEEEKEYPDGEVLVETEPIRYELTMIQFKNDRAKIKKTRVELGSGQMRNEQPGMAKMETAVAYESEYSMYWGQGRGVLKGLPTIIRNPNGTILEEIRWGITEPVSRKNTEDVEVTLEGGTGVNVTLYGNHTEREIPYVAKLVAVYEDGANRARNIEGIRFEVFIAEIVKEFGPTYFTGNNTLVPTTTTTTTTTTTVSTTSVPTTTPPPTTQPVETTKRSDTEPAAKSENSSMMNDQGIGASQKQRKETSSSHSGSALLGPGLITLITTHLILWS